MTTTNTPIVRSIDWYKDRLRDDSKWLTRKIELTYADTNNSITCQRVNRRLTEQTDVSLWDYEATTGDRERRTTVWLADSLLWAGEEYILGHYTHALRGLLQATGYAAKLGGGMGGMDSALITLRNALEAVTERQVADDRTHREAIAFSRSYQNI